MSTAGQIVDMDREELKRGLAAGDILLVDVREPHEWATGHIPGSVSMPLSAFDPSELEAVEQRIVFSCAAGVRSLHAIAMAQASGLGLNTHFRGGFREWAMAGEPVDAGA